MSSSPALIGLDWGTTSFRAYRLDGVGDLLEAKNAPAGILKVPGGDFEGVFEREIGRWLAEAPALPVIASGMITSRQGWVEVPYCACPAGSAEIAGTLLRHETGTGRIVHFVPGLSIVGADGVPDVIRGEETQIIGEVGNAPGRHLLVLPGTHSKWALVEDGRLVWFATFMTGELFGSLKEHSILGRLIEGDQDDDAAFWRGLDYARRSDGGLLKRLFSARTLGLFGELPGASIASYLSGLLIGTEVREALDCLEQPPADQEITVVGASDLTGRYLVAIEHAGLRGRRARDDAGARGLFLIARAAGLRANDWLNDVVKSWPLVMVAEKRIDFSEKSVKFENVEWRDNVMKLMQSAKAIIILPGTRPGIIWELEQLEKLGYYHKTVVLMPPGPVP